LKTVLYCRVSVASQTIDHQVTQAEAAGFKLDEVVFDDGVSGVTTKLADRPQGRRLSDMLRHGDTLVVRWVDRLGRDYRDVSDTIRTLMRRGVIIKTVVNSMTFDGSTNDAMQMAVRDALIGFMAATAQAQAEATREAQKAGIDHAKAKGGRYRGRKPSFNRPQLETAMAMLGQEAGVSMVAKETGLSRQTIHRVKANPMACEAALTAWETIR